MRSTWAFVAATGSALALVPSRSTQTNASDSLWRGGGQLAAYSSRRLRPVEVMLLVRHRDELGGRLLEIGCGGGRLTGYLIDLAREVTAVDISERMVAHCRATYPRGTFRVHDLRDRLEEDDASFDAIVAGFNVIDVLDDAERGRALDELQRLLRPDGLLIFSSHNLASPIRPPTHVRKGNPLQTAADVVRMPRRVRNRRRLRRFEERHPGHAILNDSAHDYSLLHYYATRDVVAQQLAAHGFALVECLDLDARPVAVGESGGHASELHYVARRQA